MGDRRVAVAYSGGRDSTALLHATLQEAGPLGIEVHALHVHHGLTPLADDWLAHCEALCLRWAQRGWPVRFAAQRVLEPVPAGDSVEAWARQVRYRALAQMARAHGVTLVLLAHHRRDQAETLLLQALRGGGVAGLAGMPRGIRRDGIDWQRPWLDRPREEIEAYVRRHRLAHVEDPSNQEVRYARNRLRVQVWPALLGAFEHAEASLAAAAQWAQQASAVLEESGEQDLVQLAPAPEAALRIAPWRELSLARRSNVLRVWFKRQTGANPPASLIVRLQQELTARSSARWPLGSVELRLHRGLLRCEHIAASAPASPQTEPQAVLRVDSTGIFELPGWGGALHVAPVAEHGVPLAWLARVELRARVGGERFQAGIGRPPRSLKKQYQDGGVAAWDRQGPLLYSGGQLVFVPGLGLDARVLGLPGQELVELRWEGSAAIRRTEPGGPAR